MFGQKSDLTGTAAEHLQLLIAFNQSGLNVEAFTVIFQSVNQAPLWSQVGKFPKHCAF